MHEYSLFPTTPKQNLSISAALKKSLLAAPVGSLIQIPSYLLTYSMVQSPS